MCDLSSSENSDVDSNVKPKSKGKKSKKRKSKEIESESSCYESSADCSESESSSSHHVKKLKDKKKKVKKGDKNHPVKKGVTLAVMVNQGQHQYINIKNERQKRKRNQRPEFLLKKQSTHWLCFLSCLMGNSCPPLSVELHLKVLMLIWAN